MRPQADRGGAGARFDPNRSIGQQHGTLDDESKSTAAQILKRNALPAPELFNHEDGSSLGLNIPLLDAVNRLLGQPDLMSELILAQPQHRPCRSQLGGKRSSLYTHDAIDLQGVPVVRRFPYQLH